MKQTKANTALGTLSTKPLVEEGATVRSPKSRFPCGFHFWDREAEESIPAYRLGGTRDRSGAMSRPQPPARAHPRDPTPEAPPQSTPPPWQQEPRQRPCSVFPHPPRT